MHPLVSGRLALITVTGRHSGRAFTIPVGYRQEAGRVTVNVGAPERKRWWRNLRDGDRVRLRLRGQEHHGSAVAVGDEEAGVTVEIQLDPATTG